MTENWPGYIGKSYKVSSGRIDHRVPYDSAVSTIQGIRRFITDLKNSAYNNFGDTIYLGLIIIFAVPVLGLLTMVSWIYLTALEEYTSWKKLPSARP